jgi:hypothetical protein
MITLARVIVSTYLRMNRSVFVSDDVAELPKSHKTSYIEVWMI